LQEPSFLETKARSFVKAATWRSGGLVVTMVVAWMITGQVALATTIGVADTVVKLVAYYVHERAWLRVKFGQARPKPEYEI
jgi:adenylylsulfate kinase